MLGMPGSLVASYLTFPPADPVILPALDRYAHL
jgi:hypothetical protein